MNPDLLMSFGRMFPDYIHPALAPDANDIAPSVEPWLEPMTHPVSFAEVTSFVDEFYNSIAAQTSSRSFPRLGESGIQDAGHFLTLDTLVSHSADDACSECSLS